MLNERRNRPVIVFVLLLLLSLACGSSNTGTVVTPAAESESGPGSAGEPGEQEGSGSIGDAETEVSEAPAFEVYNVGDLIEVQDHTIRLNSVEYRGTILQANFTIENLGSSDLNISSLLSFSAKRSDGTRLDEEIFDCEGTSFGGTVLPGDLLRGDICWSDASPEDGIRIYYEADLFGSGAIVWDAVAGTSEDIGPQGEPPVVQVFQAGDVVEVSDHTIRVNSIAFSGSVLVVDFTVENTGSSDITISSLASFSAKRSDGVLLDQEYFDCGTSSLDGKVLPGDRLRGKVCWSAANPEDAIKIYYEADLFGEGAVVWDAVEADAGVLEVGDPQLSVETFSAGELIQLSGQTIILNSVEITNGVLKANFTIENQGTEDVNVSSLLSFYARVRDGSELEVEIFSCGTSFDGSVIPGDKLTGDICWSGASIEDGIRIYYEADFIGEGAVVWIVVEG